jgi:hypothetical protein
MQLVERREEIRGEERREIDFSPPTMCGYSRKTEVPYQEPLWTASP